ncbi:MAG: hypothetical protein IPO66_19750 [Rhodanobacteraceae bacterium]|nr:hypothetical protein [Rhodanobacteraceae bacterium]
MMSYQGALQAVGFMATVIFLWAGARGVVAGEMTVGAFVAFSSIMAMASSAILRTLGVWDGLQFMSVLLNRLNDVIEPEPEQGAIVRGCSRYVHSKAISGCTTSASLGGLESPRSCRRSRWKSRPARPTRWSGAVVAARPAWSR